MKHFFALRVLLEYGTLFVLLLLCVIYSVITIDVQHPITGAAGRSLARTIADQHGPGANVLILLRKAEVDDDFAQGLRDELRRQDANVVDVMRLEDPFPLNASRQLKQLSDQQPLAAIATHNTGSSWGPLRPENFQRLQREIPVLRSAKVYKPRSYVWPNFLTTTNLLNMLNGNAEIFIIAIGMTLIIITTGIDLSVGSMVALAGVATAVLVQTLGGGAEASILAVVACGLLGILVATLAGTFSGTMVTVFKIPAFVVTLALMMVARGLAYIIEMRYNQWILGGTAAPVAIDVQAPSFGWLGQGTFLGVPNPVWLTGVLYLSAHVVMTRTSLGRYIYAVGGNAEAARLSGVPVRGVLILVYTISGALTGLSGIIAASRFESGEAGAGNLYELKVIAAVVVGGTSLVGGQGKITGTLVGALLIVVIENGLNMAGVDVNEQQVIFGLLILFAALLDRLKQWSGRSVN